MALLCFVFVLVLEIESDTLSLSCTLAPVSRPSQANPCSHTREPASPVKSICRTRPKQTTSHLCVPPRGLSHYSPFAWILQWASLYHSVPVCSSYNFSLYNQNSHIRSPTLHRLLLATAMQVPRRPPTSSLSICY